MLYSIPLKLNEQDYRIKIGMAEIFKAEEKGLSIDEANISLKVGLELICLCLKKVDEATNKLINVNMPINEFIEMWDNSEYSIDDLNDFIDKAIDLGLYKGKEKKTPIIPMN